MRGYAAKRNQVDPPQSRGATALSPYIRHGLLTLTAVWEHATTAPARDRQKFRDELLWQEYARHLYARLGHRTQAALRYEPARATDAWEDPWPQQMECMNFCAQELESDGWLVNQTRMWMSSQWTVRAGGDWREGEDRFFRHLLDGSRAANRLGWQWTIGAGTGRPYGFSRWQVERRAPALCQRCELRTNCPIEEWPPRTSASRLPDPDPRLRADPALDRTSGPATVKNIDDAPPEAVWLTAESLGASDPALQAHPELPAVFVWDERLLRRLRLSGKRLVFLAETLAEIGSQRPLELRLGDPAETLKDRRLAVTFAPVPGFRRLARKLRPAEIHPWPWLAPPHAGSIISYSAWRKRLTLA